VEGERWLNENGVMCVGKGTLGLNKCSGAGVVVQLAWRGECNGPRPTVAAPAL
jgi:hypothetical protein